MKQGQQQSQKQLQKQGYFLSQQHLKLMHLMHLSGYALHEYIANELEQNPALELENDSPNDDEENNEEDNVFDPELFNNDDDLFEKNYKQASKEDYYEAPVIHFNSLTENLKDQVHQMHLDVDLTEMACYVIDELEDDGYLRRSLTDVSFDYGFAKGKLSDEKKFEEALTHVQKCDPPGIAARDLRECLLLQVIRKYGAADKNPLITNVKEILEHQYDLFVERSFTKIKTNLNISDDDFKKILEIIHHLNPKPVTETNKYEIMRQQIIPEFEINFEDGDMFVSFTQKESFKLKVNPEFDKSILRTHSDSEKKQAVKYYSSMIEEAQSLVNALLERESTMMKVISFIATLQTKFFETGDNKDLKPMILQDVATATSFDVSTISRITSNKHVQTPHGIYALKNLFMRNVNPDLDLNSQNTAVGIQDEIKKIIEEEDKSSPLSDSVIVKKLSERGIALARRTVVKYREAIGIPNSTLRKG